MSMAAALRRRLPPTTSRLSSPMPVGSTASFPVRRRALARRCCCFSCSSPPSHRPPSSIQNTHVRETSLGQLFRLVADIGRLALPLMHGGWNWFYRVAVEAAARPTTVPRPLWSTAQVCLFAIAATLLGYGYGAYGASLGARVPAAKRIQDRGATESEMDKVGLPAPWHLHAV